MSFYLALASMVLSAAACVCGLLYIRSLERAWQARHDELSARINLLVLEESRHRRSVSDVLGEREVSEMHQREPTFGRVCLGSAIRPVLIRT